jgi:hypothetical protein
MTDQEKVDWLFEHQATTDLEHELQESAPGRVQPFKGDTKHVAQLFEIVLETGRTGYFKPMEGWTYADAVSKRTLVNYGHDQLSATLSECAAWQVAKGLGSPWDELVVPTVIRAIPVDGTPQVGSLAVYRAGRDGTREFYKVVPDQAAAGAFFDCLIGQQDRNKGNVLWHDLRRQVHLIDHSFSFGRRKDNTGSRELGEWRWNVQKSSELSAAEKQALNACSGGPPFEIDNCLAADRVSALVERVERMLTRGEILRGL